MNHLKWMGHPATIMEIQRNLRQDIQTCDVTISAKDSAMQAHRFVLCACSDFFRDIFRDIPSDKETTIIIPDLKSNILERVLTFIYLGEVCVSSSQLSDFLESINFLGIKSPISFECHLNKVEQKIEDSTINNEEKDNQNVEEQGNPTSETEVCHAKEFEYLEVYNDEDKIDHYAIEQIEPETNNDYMITDNPAHSTFNLNDSKSEITLTSNTETRTLVLSESVEQISIEKVDTVEEQNSETLKLKTELYVNDENEVNEENDINDVNDDNDDNDVNTMVQCRNDALESAMKAVIDDGMSLQKASNMYQVSKTVLWRRVRKHPNYKIKGNPLITAAVEKLAQGETLKSVSLALDIPLSTLHRHKMKLYQEGRLPENIQIRKKDSKENLKLRLNNAVNACRSGMSQNHASTVFGVPKSTLWRHIKKLNPRIIKEENPIVIKEDQQLVVDDASFTS